MFDYFKKGYADGMRDFQQGKGYNFNRGIPKLSALISNKAIKTYVDGYKKGYTVAKKKKYGL